MTQFFVLKVNPQTAEKLYTVTKVCSWREKKRYTKAKDATDTEQHDPSAVETVVVEGSVKWLLVRAVIVIEIGFK